MRIFVTGTDTGVGKTHVACGILRALRDAGVVCAPFKPVETGVGQDRRPVDGAALLEASGAGLDIDDVVPVQLEEAMAPAVAAERNGAPIDVAALDRAYGRLGSFDAVVVEGAGGITVPIGPDVTMADLARRWDLPVVVVCRPGLGTLNHTVLTVDHARRRGLAVMGLVVNGTSARPDAVESTNMDWLPRLTGVPVLATVPWGAPAEVPLPLAAGKP